MNLKYKYAEIISEEDLGEDFVYDLSVTNDDHSFIHSSGMILHNSAVVITDGPIEEILPLQMVGETQVTQYTKDTVERCGGIKLDLLGVNGLNDLQGCIKTIQLKDPDFQSGNYIINEKRVPSVRILPHNGQFLDIYDLPPDQAVFNDICESKTETCFQINTPSAQKWLKNFNFVKKQENEITYKGLCSIEDLAAFIALDRPGALDAYVGSGSAKHNMLQEFAIRVRGGKPTEPMAILDELLPKTHGVIVFQEDLNLIFQNLGDTTAAEADDFRAHISKKNAAAVIKDKAIFMKGAVERIGLQEAERLWLMMESFSAYGFNKSHSFGYGLVAYATAYLKHYYPLEWWASVLTNAKKDKIIDKLWKHCHKIIKMPDINISTERWEIEGEFIRAPIDLLMGIGEKAHEELMANRPYADLKDLLIKIENTKTKNKANGGRKHSSVSESVINKLIIAGSMDSFFEPDISTLEKLVVFQQTLAEVTGKKVTAVDQKYTNLTPYQLYLVKKSILPVYCQELSKMMIDTGHKSIKADPGSERKYFQFDGQDYPIVTAKEFERLNSDNDLLPRGGIRVCVVGFACEAEKFSYHSNKQAFKTVIDLNGDQIELLKWPDRNTGKLRGIPDIDFKGSLVILLLNKYKEDKPFSIDEIFQLEKGI